MNARTAVPGYDKTESTAAINENLAKARAYLAGAVRRRCSSVDVSESRRAASLRSATVPR